MVLSIYLEFPVLPLYAWPRLQRPIWRSEDLVDEEQRFYGTMNYILRLATSSFVLQLIIVLSSYGQQLVKLDSTESLHSGRIFLGALFLSALLLFLIAFHHNFGLHTSCFPYWPVFHGIDSGCRREIQALSWLNVASRVGVFLLVENSSLVNSGCHYKQIFASICVGGETSCISLEYREQMLIKVQGNNISPVRTMKAFVSSNEYANLPPHSHPQFLHRHQHVSNTCAIVVAAWIDVILRETKTNRDYQNFKGGSLLFVQSPSAAFEGIVLLWFDENENESKWEHHVIGTGLPPDRPHRSVGSVDVARMGDDSASYIATCVANSVIQVDSFGPLDEETHTGTIQSVCTVKIGGREYEALALRATLHLNADQLCTWILCKTEIMDLDQSAGQLAVAAFAEKSFDRLARSNMCLIFGSVLFLRHVASISYTTPTSFYTTPTSTSRDPPTKRSHQPDLSLA
ncbi:hypothetical protein C8J56DRAFT_1032297 [Mycena floridula]|nr:hypothetical protein C8J56DRAFT_1032297 [Mycena floridula]